MRPTDEILRNWATIIAAAAAIVAACVAAIAYSQRTLADLYKQLGEVTRLYVAKPELRGYFHCGKPCADDDKEACLAVAELYCDFFEGLVTLMWSLPRKSKPGWRAYIQYIWVNSPVLREYWDTHGALYDPRLQAAVEAADKLLADPFGYSLPVDMTGISAAVCNDEKFCEQVLLDLVVFLKMRQQSDEGAWVIRTPASFGPAFEGCTGFVPLIQSGITIHTLAKKGFVSIDIYTCGKLDKKATYDFLRNTFRPKTIVGDVVVRGRGYQALALPVA